MSLKSSSPCPSFNGLYYSTISSNSTLRTTVNGIRIAVPEPKAVFSLQRPLPEVI
jgi:hypothetical protein